MNSLIHTGYAAPARDLLALLTEEDLTALVKTATCGRILPADRAEAHTAILLTCQDVPKLLSHRKLTSHLLLQYLLSKGITVNGHVSRVQLVMTISQYWDKQLAAKASKTIKKEEQHNVKIKEEQDQQQHTEIKHKFSDNSNEFSFDDISQHEQEDHKPTIIHTSAANCSSQLSTGSGSSKNSLDYRLLAHSSANSVSHSHSPCSSNLVAHSPSPCSSNLVALSTPSCSSNSTGPSPPSSSLSNDSAASASSTGSVRVMSDEFSQDFCEWFYAMLNRLQPECADRPGDSLRPEIFCSNCKVEMYLVEGERTEQCVAEDSVPCEAIIRQLLLKLKLLFVPNLDGGLQASKSTHGMIQLFCCGTLHSGSTFLGIFEQEFGLVMSPIDRAWKIAYTKVNLKKVNKIQTPSLPRTEIFAIEF